MWTWIGLGLVGVFVVGPLIRRSVLYARVYAPPFLRELRVGLERARASALGAVGREVAPEELLASGSAFVTGPGLAFAYTITPLGFQGSDGYEHHLSMSYRGAGFALSAAAFVAAALRRLLDPGAGVEVTMAVAPSGVYHIVFHLTTEQHEAYAARAVTPLADADLAAFIGECMKDRAAVAGAVRPLAPDAPPAA